MLESDGHHRVERQSATGVETGSLARWLDDDVTLTPTELRIVRVLGYRLGSWVPKSLIASAVYHDGYHQRAVVPADMASIRTHIWRVRRKLAPTHWRIENRYKHGLYRLVPSE